MALKSEITTANGSKVTVVRAQEGDTPARLKQELALPVLDAVVVLAGGASALDPAVKPRLTQLIGRGLLRALGEFKSLCVLRAGDDSVADLVGACARDALHQPLMLGVAPAGKVGGGEGAMPALVPSLSHLVVAPGAQWGDEGRARIDLAQSVLDGRHTMLLLIGGETRDLDEVLQAVRRRWPVVLVKGSGGAADALARQKEVGTAEGDDPVVAEILADGQLTQIDLASDIAVAVEAIAREVERACAGLGVLRQVWQRFASIDAAAIREQKWFFRIQVFILLLGVFGAVIVASQGVLPEVGSAPAGLGAALASAGDAASAPASAAVVASSSSAASGLEVVLRVCLLLQPIVLSVFIAIAVRFNFGKRWVLLRTAAEGIKREIYLFRLHAEGYASDDRREKALALAVENITRRLLRTEVNTSSLPQPAGDIPPRNTIHPGDDGLSLLTTDQYVRLRLQDQLQFYRRKTVTLEVSWRRINIAMIALGGVGTLIGVVGGGYVIWITVTTTLSAALASYMSLRQVENTLIGYNQTATDLENIHAWWMALETVEQQDPVNIKLLADNSEAVIGNEVERWNQKMSDSLEQLRKESEARAKAGKPPAPPPQPPAEGDEAAQGGDGSEGGDRK
ncbi:MAG: hypothetical protein RL375_39 [Pseudomonadota bacterium]|jgi:hypothetical protein